MNQIREIKNGSGSLSYIFGINDFSKDFLEGAHKIRQKYNSVERKK